MTRTPCKLSLAAVIGALGLVCWVAAGVDASTTPQVELDASQTGPRAVESLTEKAIVRDYTQAWNSLAEALDHNQPDFLNGYFVGTAQEQLAAAVADQKATDIRVHYLGQRHQLKAVFYAPEGDVMELQDTLECDLQVTDGTAVIHQEHATVRYVILMTPGADRWVVRHMQAVSAF